MLTFNSDTINVIKTFIENEIEKEINKTFKETSITHNHPPLRFKVDDCEYCQKFGNIFCLN